MGTRKLLVLPVALVLGACTDVGPTALVEEPVRMSAAAAPGFGPVANQKPTVVDVALAVNAETGEFSTLIAAVVAADLVDWLSANGQRTVFAPTDAAFADLGLNAGNIGALPVATLREILRYHVTTGRRDAASVVSASRLRMTNGGFTTIRLENGAAFINNAQIIATDVLAGNGIIHVIDAVLLP